ncbi:hypothetical protein F2Q68_00006220 [Brassica cretica]|uniref:Uncharacterized protein n=1 Tax=Brassica cretica TaxID=69181 RepID=A0A8S9JNA8_BRACR|nr:hypothetical protein F2Q68_00006220 [Brassica cretica]
MAIVSSLPLLAQGRTLGSLAYLPNSKLGSVLQECDIATMIKATVESLEGQLCSNEVMVRHELGQRQESLLRFRYLRISNGLMLLMFLSSRGMFFVSIEEAAHVPNVYHSYIKRWCKETGVYKVEIAHKEVHDAVFGGPARNREEADKEAKEGVENGNQGFGCAKEDK